METKNPYTVPLHEAIRTGNIEDEKKYREFCNNYIKNYLDENVLKLKKIVKESKQLDNVNPKYQYARAKRIYRDACEIVKNMRSFKKEMRENKKVIGW